MSRGFDASPIVLIYGYRGAPLGLEDLAGFLRKDGFEVHIPIIPPFGGGGDVLPKYTAEAYADYLATWLKQEGLDKRQPLLVGHSMGSIVVAATAERHPEVMGEKIVFMAPIARKVVAGIRWLTPLAAVLPNKLISLISTRFLLVKRGEFWRIWRLSAQCGAEVASKKSDYAAAKFSAGNAIGDFDFRQQACFVIGEKDRLNSVKAVRALAKKYKGAKVKTLSGTGHLLNYEAPERVAKIIERAAI